MATAMASAVYSPLRPPISSPPNNSRPLMIPSSRAVFIAFIRVMPPSYLIIARGGWVQRIKLFHGDGYGRAGGARDADQNGDLIARRDACRHGGVHLVE